MICQNGGRCASNQEEGTWQCRCSINYAEKNWRNIVSKIIVCYSEHNVEYRHNTFNFNIKILKVIYILLKAKLSFLNM